MCVGESDQVECAWSSHWHVLLLVCCWQAEVNNKSSHGAMRRQRDVLLVPTPILFSSRKQMRAHVHSERKTSNNRLNCHPCRRVTKLGPYYGPARREQTDRIGRLNSTSSISFAGTFHRNSSLFVTSSAARCKSTSETLRHWSQGFIIHLFQVTTTVNHSVQLMDCGKGSVGSAAGESVEHMKPHIVKSYSDTEGTPV